MYNSSMYSGKRAKQSDARSGRASNLISWILVEFLEKLQYA